MVKLKNMVSTLTGQDVVAELRNPCRRFALPVGRNLVVWCTLSMGKAATAPSVGHGLSLFTIVNDGLHMPCSTKEAAIVSSSLPQTGTTLLLVTLPQVSCIPSPYTRAPCVLCVPRAAVRKQAFGRQRAHEFARDGVLGSHRPGYIVSVVLMRLCCGRHLFVLCTCIFNLWKSYPCYVVLIYVFTW